MPRRRADVKLASWFSFTQYSAKETYYPIKIKSSRPGDCKPWIPVHHLKGHLNIFLLVFALATPFWVLNSIIKVERLPLDLPITDLALAFMPLTAASILVFRKKGPDDVRRLLKRVLDFGRVKPKIWYVPTVLLMLLLYLLIYGTIHLMGLPLLSEPNIPLLISLLFVLFFVLVPLQKNSFAIWHYNFHRYVSFYSWWKWLTFLIVKIFTDFVKKPDFLQRNLNFLQWNLNFHCGKLQN